MSSRRRKGRRFSAHRSRLGEHSGPHADGPVLYARELAGRCSSSRQACTSWRGGELARYAAEAGVCLPGAAVRSSQRSGTSSAGRPPEQLLDSTALALGRTPRTAVARSHRDSLLAWWRGRAVVDVALGGNRCAGTFGDDPQDDHDAFASLLAQPHLITGPDRMRGLDPRPVDPDVPGPAGTGRGRAGPGQPHRPHPAVHSPAPLIPRPPAPLFGTRPLPPPPPPRPSDPLPPKNLNAVRARSTALSTPPATKVTGTGASSRGQRAPSLHGFPQVARARIGRPERPSVRETAGTSTIPLPSPPKTSACICGDDGPLGAGQTRVLFWRRVQQAGRCRCDDAAMTDRIEPFMIGVDSAALDDLGDRLRRGRGAEGATVVGQERSSSPP